MKTSLCTIWCLTTLLFWFGIGGAVAYSVLNDRDGFALLWILLTFSFYFIGAVVFGHEY